jgi:hypothetical protein
MRPTTTDDAAEHKLTVTAPAHFRAQHFPVGPVNGKLYA